MTGADLLAGLSVAGLLLPEAVAYAGIGGVPPQHAVAAAVAGLVVYAAIGGSRFAVVAPTSSSAAIVAASLAELSPGTPEYRLALAFGMVLLTGAYFLAAGMARFGNLSAFIARPVLRGFGFGLAVTIVVKQLPLLVGVAGVGGSPFLILRELAHRVGEWHPYSAATGVAALAVLFALKRWPRIPGAFVALVLGVAASRAADLPGHGVQVVGVIDITGLVPGLPDLARADWARLCALALPLFMIVFAESWGSMRYFALRHNDTLDANRELMALGAANAAAALVQGMPVGAGFSATAANEAAGAASKLAGVAASVALAAMMLGAGGLIANLPEPVLAAVVIAALAHSLDPTPLLALWRIGRDQYVALVAAVVVIAFGVVDGMLIAVGLSLAAALQRFSRPQVSELGELGDSRNYVDRMRHPEALTSTGIAIFRPMLPMFFANAELMLAEIGARLERQDAVQVVVLSLEESSDLDSTAAETLIAFDAQVKGSGRVLLFARIKDEVRDRLARAGAASLVQPARCYRSVADAVAAAEALLR
ncbi:SulP family inorganic anion transporter [Limobrevibacterium gyesilva]|uniref:SulP family inorganic anion transporter n=1 Tax=Limobrevibacterium gyesilva TaxID=2991712 RepID=A0AA41YN07_9PROT|nr:SulP family inorganic anion transporter [Limobrevibacterium gyesilva]MCW3475033.1 SulP family inorganic anion transporter [Limobrevibacterium gyesilva]